MLFLLFHPSLFISLTTFLFAIHLLKLTFKGDGNGDGNGEVVIVMVMRWSITKMPTVQFFMLICYGAERERETERMILGLYSI